MDPHQIGVYSETVAVYYLQRLGYTLIARNYRCRYGEIDSVFLDGEVLVFVEVKHIGKVGADSLSFQIDRRKRAKIVAAANDFLFSHPEKRNLLIRFDVVAISVDIRSIRHFKNAFEENALL